MYCILLILCICTFETTNCLCFFEIHQVYILYITIIIIIVKIVMMDNIGMGGSDNMDGNIENNKI